MLKIQTKYPFAQLAVINNSSRNHMRMNTIIRAVYIFDYCIRVYDDTWEMSTGFALIRKPHQCISHLCVNYVSGSGVRESVLTHATCTRTSLVILCLCHPPHTKHAEVHQNNPYILLRTICIQCLVSDAQLCSQMYMYVCIDGVNMNVSTNLSPQSNSHSTVYSISLPKLLTYPSTVDALR